MDTITVDLLAERMRPVLDALKEASVSPGEAALMCLALFVQLWEVHEGGSLADKAEAARQIILSYHAGPLQ